MLSVSDTIETIVSTMQSRSGSAYADISTDVLTSVIEQEWNSGNWVMLTGDDPSDFWGWVSYYPVDKVSLAVIKKFRIEGCIKRRFPINTGHHIYLGNCVIAPDASPLTYRRLYSLAVLRNPHAESINAHLVNRKGQTRWFTREGPNRESGIK